jgi:hypothetical protein
MAPRATSSAALADLVPPTAITIRVWRVFLYQRKPHPCHLQENGSVLFILGGSRHFQALCSEATVLVRPVHGEQPRFLAICLLATMTAFIGCSVLS